MIDLEQLKGLRFFEGVAPGPVEDLVKECAVRSLNRGEVSAWPGESNHKLYLVLSGHLTVHLESVEWPALTLPGPGESLGEFSIIDQQPTSTFIVAADPCRLLIIEERIFWALVDRAPGLGRNLVSALTQRVRHNNIALADGVRQRDQQRQGVTDPLTGLRNRRWVNEMLPREIRRSVCDSRRLSLLMLDLDHFRQFNDEYGQAAGDNVLAEIGRVLERNLRPTDLVARFGGEEFLVILPNTDLNAAQVVAERLRRAVEQAPITIADSTAYSITLSIGLVQLHPTQKMDSLLAAADSALRRAKVRAATALPSEHAGRTN